MALPVTIAANALPVTLVDANGSPTFSGVSSSTTTTANTTAALAAGAAVVAVTTGSVANVVATLPLAAASPRQIGVMKIDSGSKAIVLTAAGSDHFMLAGGPVTTLTLTTRGDSALLESDPTDGLWLVISARIGGLPA